MRSHEPGWNWDPSLFAGAARHYARGRLPYSPALAGSLRDALGLDGRGQLLDLGCGPGSVTLPLAPLYARAVGLDPDPHMVAEAARLADEADLDNIQWIQARAEDAAKSVAPGSFRTITLAASFHWMDRDAVAAAALRLLDRTTFPDGPNGAALVHIDSRHQDGLRPAPELPEVPRAQIDSLRQAYLGPARRAGAGTRESSPDGEATVLRAAGFTGPDVVIASDGRIIERTIENVVDECFSMSYSAPHLFGARLRDFEADLRRLLKESAPNGVFGVVLPDNELNIWRPAD